AAQHPVPDTHEVSKALRVDLKSMPATERTLASSVPPTLLAIGELSERTGVPTSALRYYDELDWCGRRLGGRDDGVGSGQSAGWWRAGGGAGGYQIAKESALTSTVSRWVAGASTASSWWPRRMFCIKASPAITTLALWSCLSARIGRSLAF